MVAVTPLLLRTVPDENDPPVVSLCTATLFGKTVPAGAVIVIVSPLASAPVALVVNVTMYLTCGTPPAVDVRVGVALAGVTELAMAGLAMSASRTERTAPE